MSIKVDGLSKRFGDKLVIDDVSFVAADGEFVSLLGPSGCGKTTTLRCVAGLETPDAGHIEIGGRVVFDAARGEAVPPHQRNIGMVFQSYALWPHLTVFENVAFPLQIRKLAKDEIARRVAETLGLVGLGDLGDRKSSELSGGQQQRVAVARAIVQSPDAMLLDEPLSNLDAKLRAEMRVELRELQRRLDITSVYVTHDQEEALAISDRVIVMHVGGIEQIGTPEDIYHRPKTRFVADFVGSANLIEGRIAGSADGSGRIRFESTGGLTLDACAAHRPRGNEDTVAVRTAHIGISVNGGAAPTQANSAAGRIRQRLFHGDFIQYVVDWPAGQLIVRRPPTDLFAEGAAVTLSFAAEHCVLLEG